MTSADREPDREVFRQYHRVGRRRALRAALVTLAVVVIGGGAITGVSVLAATHQSTASAPSGPPITLTKATFASAVQHPQSVMTSYHFSTEVTTNGQAVTAKGEISAPGNAADASMSMTMDVPTVGKADLRMIGRRIYLNLGQATQNKYVAFDDDDPANPLLPMFAAIDKATDVKASVGQVENYIRSVTVAGPAVTLDGVEAVPYDVMVDTKAIASELGMEASHLPIPDQVTYRYWVGPDRLIRKISFNSAGINEVVQFEKWGQPVSITKPTADQIITAAALK